MKKKKNTSSSAQTVKPSLISKVLKFADESPVAFWSSLALAAIAFILYYPNHFGDYDIWWHLKYGEHFVSNTTWLIDHTQFSWTETDGSWKYVTWIGSSLLFLIHKAFGFAGLHLLQYFILASMGGMLYVFCRISGIKFGPAHIGALLLSLAAMNPTAIFIKPELFTIVLFSLTVFIYFVAKNHNAKLFYLYPLLFLLWVNTHGAFLIGLMFLAALVLLETVDLFLLKTNPLSTAAWRTLLISSLLSLAATCINPYGPSYVIETVVRLAGGGGDMSALMAYTERWKHLFPKVYAFRRTNTAWALIIMEAAAIIVFIRAFVNKRIIDVTLIGVNVLFFFFAMTMSRAILYFPPIFLFTLFYLLQRSDSKRPSGVASTIGIIVTIAVSAIILYNTTYQNIYMSWFGSMADDFTPGKATAVLKESGFPGPVFNDYLCGGYMIYAAYPQYKVFIDPRHRPYESTGVWDDFVSLRKNANGKEFHAFMQKYPFKTAMINHLHYVDLAILFLRSTEWQMVYVDNVAAIFLHTSFKSALDPTFMPEHMAVERFENIENPAFLTSLFQLFLYNDIRKSRKIMEYFEANVSNRYVRKANTLKLMESTLFRGKNSK